MYVTILMSWHTQLIQMHGSHYAFDSSFASEARNVSTSLTTDGFSLFNLNALSY